MKFSTRQDIEAPIDYVFDRAADFDAHIRQAMRRGIEVERIDTLQHVAPGMRWSVRFGFRGKPRQMHGELVHFDAPDRFVIQSFSNGIEVEFVADLVPLSASRTRLIAGLELLPKTLPSRLLLQSLKLGKHKLDQRYSRKIAQFGEETEEKYARGA